MTARKVAGALAAHAAQQDPSPARTRPPSPREVLDAVRRPLDFDALAAAPQPALAPPAAPMALKRDAAEQCLAASAIQAWWLHRPRDAARLRARGQLVAAAAVGALHGRGSISTAELRCGCATC